MNRNDNNWFKLFAVMAVAGVAKHLFGPEQAPRITYTQAAEAVDKVKELRPEHKS